MIAIWRSNDIGSSAITAPVLRRRFAPSTFRAVAVDISPGCRAEETDLIWTDSHYVAVDLMDIPSILMHGPVPHVNALRDSSKGGELWAGDVAEWVEVNSVYSSANPYNEQLHEVLGYAHV